MDLEALLKTPEWKLQPETRILFPSDQSFASETERWNTDSAPTFKAAIRPGSEEDAQKAVSFDKTEYLTGGQHIKDTRSN